MPANSPPSITGDYGRDIALLHQTQEAHDRQIKEQGSRMEEGFRAIGASIENLRTSFTNAKATNWPLVLAILAACGTLITGGWAIIQMRINAEGAPLLAGQALMQQAVTNLAASLSKVSDNQQQVKGDLAANSAADASSKDDRAHLNAELDRLKDLFAKSETDRRADSTALFAKNAEIETQFRSMDDRSNIQWASSQRQFAMLYEEATGRRYPSDIAYYPKIGQQAGTTNGK